MADVLSAWIKLDPTLRDIAQTQSSEGEGGRRLLDLADERVAAMDVAGIDVSVLSLTAPGLQSLEADDEVALQGPVNDRSPRPSRSGQTASMVLLRSRLRRPTPRRTSSSAP